MPITVVTTFKIDPGEARRLAGKASEIMKCHGAVSVRLGFCHAGSRTGTTSVIVNYADWASYGRSAQSFYEDPKYQELVAEASKVGELVDRSIMVTQEI